MSRSFAFSPISSCSSSLAISRYISARQDCSRSHSGCISRPSSSSLSCLLCLFCLPLSQRQTLYPILLPSSSLYPSELLLTTTTMSNLTASFDAGINHGDQAWQLVGLTGADRYSASQELTTDCWYLCSAAVHPRTGNHVCRSVQSQMGYQFGVHGALRFRGHHGRMGPLCVQQ